MDWYYIEIPPLWRSNIVVTDRQITEEDRETSLMIYVQGTIANPIIQNKAITIDNYNDYMTRYYFMIYPKESAYISGPGGSIVDYTLRILDFKPIY